MTDNKNLGPIVMSAARILDKHIAKIDPDVRFAVCVWKQDSPDIWAGDFAFTTNDVPGSGEVLKAIDISEVEDPNAWVRQRQ